MPRIYVGTYAKYNNGSISGSWLDLESYDSRFEFMQACAVLHFDEADPELMFQDWEGIPDKFISESHLAEDIWPNWIDMDTSTRACCALAWDNVDKNMTAKQVINRYAGAFDSEVDWAHEIWSDTGMLNDIPEFAQRYIDYTAYARDCQLEGSVTFVRKQGQIHVFHND